MPYAFCPGCDQRIFLRKDPKVGDMVYCPNCEDQLEVVAIDPIELDWPWDEDEDEGSEWDEEEEEEEEWEDEDEDE